MTDVGVVVLCVAGALLVFAVGLLVKRAKPSHPLSDAEADKLRRYFQTGRGFHTGGERFIAQDRPRPNDRIQTGSK